MSNTSCSIEIDTIDIESVVENAIDEALGDIDLDEFGFTEKLQEEIQAATEEAITDARHRVRQEIDDRVQQTIKAAVAQAWPSIRTSITQILMNMD